ncbi:MAG: ketopantoate reductase family protein [Miltoncostaeaceae bacterium]
MTEDPPRTLLVGAGAIGGFVAAGLVERGWPIRVLARGATLQALRRGPLHIEESGATRSVRLKVVDDPGRDRSIELAILATKSHDTAGVAARLGQALAPDALVLSLQNGVHNGAALRRALAGANVAEVAVYLGCQRTAPDRIVRRPSVDRATGAPRDRLVGPRGGAAADALRQIGRAIDLRVDLVDDIERALWTKLVANVCLNTVTALGRARVGRLFADPEAVSLMLALGAEVEAVARASGVDLPPGAARAYVADARRRLPATGGSSTLFDLEAGRRLEHGAMVGSVARDGARLGVPVPVSRTCSALLDLLDPARRGN